MTFVPVRPHPHCAQLELRVPFHDVDQMHIVWHGHYFKYFELVRTQLLRHLGFPQGLAKIGPYYWVMIESHCKHIAPLHYDERFWAQARLRDIQYRVTIEFELWNLDRNRRIAKAYSRFATLDASKTLQLETPNEMLELLRAPT